MFVIPLTTGDGGRDHERFAGFVVGGEWEGRGRHSAAYGDRFGTGDRVKSGQDVASRHQ